MPTQQPNRPDLNSVDYVCSVLQIWSTVLGSTVSLTFSSVLSKSGIALITKLWSKLFNYDIFDCMYTFMKMVVI